MPNLYEESAMAHARRIPRVRRAARRHREKEGGGWSRANHRHRQRPRREDTTGRPRPQPLLRPTSARPRSLWPFALSLSRRPRTLPINGGCRTKVSMAGCRRRWQAGSVGPACADRLGGPLGCPQALAVAIWCRWSFVRLCVAISNRHSVRTAVLPRLLNRTTPRLCRVCPNTGSTISIRFRYSC